ncbi:MAG: NCS2 family permease [Propionibacteriaceae bacterium]|jgi:AGZA family xanthine/uracil permease-like MFS transporter|nr:NCS2 family permease [Propionibacteriaceae bacterium]
MASTPSRKPAAKKPAAAKKPSTAAAKPAAATATKPKAAPSAPKTPTPAPTRPSFTLNGWFEITKRGSNVGREIRGGLVTFFTMAYIIVLNPLILGFAADKDGNLISGLPADQDGGKSLAMVAAATALVAGVMTIIMGVYGRFPVALAAGLGINSIVAGTIASQMTWPQAMGMVAWEGIIITILVLTGFRKAVMNAVPRSIRSAISVGIGLFITMVGLADAKFITAGSSTPVQLGSNGSLAGWPILVFIIGLFLLIALYVARVKGAMLIAIISTTVIAMGVNAAFSPGGYSADNLTGWALNIPAFDGWSAPDLGLIGRVDLIGAFNGASAGTILGFILLIFALLLADFFDTMGTIVAVGAEGKLLNKDGNPDHLQEILIVDSLGALAGGLGSVSSNTSYIESASGVGDGARTGLASVTTGVAFLLCLVLAPFVDMVPSEAAAPALVFVGCLMMAQVVEINWADLEESVPAFLCLALMPFAYSISVGIGAGFISHVLIKALRGKARDIHPILWAVAAAFVIYFAQSVIIGAVIGG